MLRERARDCHQKRTYFASCYNEDSIRSVIDDMLLKEHSLRKELDELLKATAILQAEGQEAIASVKKRVARERSSLEEELHLQRLENQMQGKKRERA